jgi:hypothetical protein
MVQVRVESSVRAIGTSVREGPVRARIEAHAPPQIGPHAAKDSRTSVVPRQR